MSDQSEHVKAIFESAVGIESAAERARFLERKCGVDAELRRQVESLLAAHAQAGDFLAQPAIAELGLEAHSGPPLPAGSSVLAALSSALGNDMPRVQLREPVTEGVTPVNQPDSPEMPPPHVGDEARLQLLGEIARGGMGAILKGRDVALGRDVAVKVLLETYRGRTELARRFVEEAQIAGQLQHPGVVPVYEFGVFADRRPYFTMKLVKGQTLAALLTTRKQPAEDQAKYLGIFAQVCQTLAYAHARGVIHRDLKPSNIMVGAYGEVQVMDWGLAKVLRQGGVADEEHQSPERERREDVTAIRTERSGSTGKPGTGSDTQAGTLLGTPSYMAPEQARGDVDLVDERADVFGLGAILCEILTGQPPFPGRNAEAARRAQQGRLDEALERLAGCGADGELVQMARRCLAAEPWDRPRNAGEVADQVTAYQNAVAERLRQAELAETEARTRMAEEVKTRAEAEARLAAERRARRLTLGLAAAVLLTFTLVGSGGLWYQHHLSAQREEEARRQAELREAVAAALDKVADLRQRAHWGEARAVIEQVKQRLGEGGGEDLRRQVNEAEKDLALVDRLDAARLKASVWLGRHFDHASAVREYAAAFREAGLGDETQPAEVVAERIRASAVREQLVAAVDDWTLRLRNQEREQQAWLLAVARLADPDPWRARFRDPKLRHDRSALERLAREARVNELSPQILHALAVLLRERGVDVVPLLVAAQRRFPSDFWLNIELSGVLLTNERWEEAVGYCRATVALRPATSGVYVNLGLALLQSGRVDEAIAECRKALELESRSAYARSNLGLALEHKGLADQAIAEFKKALEFDPTLPQALNNLSKALQQKGLVDEAVAECRKAVAFDPKSADAHFSLGRALGVKKNLDEAIAHFQTGVKLRPRDAAGHDALGWALHVSGRPDEAAVAFKSVIDLDPKSAGAHYGLASTLTAKGRLEEAIAEYQKAMALNPKLLVAHNDLGNALRDKGRLDEAIAEFQKAIELDPKHAPAHSNLGTIFCDHRPDFDRAVACFRRALELDPKNAQIHVNLGNALGHKSRLDEALAEYQKAVELEPKLAVAHESLGNALREHGRVDEAVVEYQKAIELDPTSAESHNHLGAIFCDVHRDFDRALACFRKALELDPKHAVARMNLGNVFRNKGRVDEAIAEYHKALELDPKYALAHNNFGAALRKKGLVDEAIGEYQKAIELDPKDPLAHDSLGSAWRDKGRVDQAIAEFRKALELNPRYASAHENLGSALYDKGLVDEAIAELKKAVELNPKNVNAHNRLGKLLRGNGRLDEAIAAYRKAIEFDPKHFGTHNNLGGALLEKGRLREAIAEFKKATELDPTFSAAHHNLGAALEKQGRLDEAIAEFKKAAELNSRISHVDLGRALLRRGKLDEAGAALKKAVQVNPKDFMAHNLLGAVLEAQGNPDETIAVLKKAIALNPTFFGSYYNLGKILSAQGKLDEAVPAYEKAIELNPSFAEAHCNLGHTFSRLGRFAEATTSLKRGHELGSQQPNWRYPSARWLHDAKQAAVLAAKLPALLKGDYQPRDNAERLRLARMCVPTKHYAAAARLYADVFAAEPKRANNEGRYNAACAAALAGSGRGEDAKQLGNKERTRWRKQALAWLRADLALRSKQAGSGKPADRVEVVKTLRHWQQDTDFASVRDPQMLERLPEEERAAWRQLWADVAALLHRLEPK